MKLIENVDYIVTKKSLLGIFGGKYRIIKAQKYESGITLDKTVNHKYFTWNYNGTITCNVGYQWDGATGGIDTDNFMRGSLWHDVGCQCVAEGLLPKSYRKAIDKMLYRILSNDGMSGFRRTYVYYMIRLYVKIAY